VLVGTSRKRITAELLARSDAPGRGLGVRRTGSGAPMVPVGERLDASLATATWAMAQGVRMVRVHDVAATAQAATVVSGGFGAAGDPLPSSADPVGAGAVPDTTVPTTPPRRTSA
jgi:hypothetical protein